MNYPIRTAAAIAAIVAASPALAGVVMEGTSQDGEQKMTQRMLMDGQKLRVEMNGGAQAMIFDGASKRTVQLDTASKSYTEFTDADFAKLKEMMKQSGAAQRAKAAQLKRRYEKTSRTDQALGKKCDVYKVLDEDGTSDEELCVAPFGTFGVQKDDFSGFRAMADFAREMSGGDLQQDWADIPGVPLISWELEDGQRVEDFRVTKIEKKSIPASEFTVPAGWKKNPGFSEQMQQMQKQQQGAAGGK